MPTNERVVRKTIHLNNGSVLTYETDKNATSGNWYKNGKRFTNYSLNKYKYYDPKIKGYRQLSNLIDFELDKSGNVEFKDVRTPVYTPYLDKLRKLANSDIEIKQNNNSIQSFKFGKKHITLRTKGNMNLATIPYNMLDSIAINSGRSNTNVKTNLGLIGKESTFGGMSIPLTNKYIRDAKEQGMSPFVNTDKNGNYDPSIYTMFPHDLTNNHAYFLNKYDDYIQAIYRKYPYTDNIKVEDANNALRELEIRDAFEHNRFKTITPKYHENIMADAFARYAANPKKYNPGQANYESMVDNIGNEVWNEPQIQKWWKEEGHTYYNKGKSGFTLGGKQKLTNY